jgi:zinc protease
MRGIVAASIRRLLAVAPALLVAVSTAAGQGDTLPAPRPVAGPAPAVRVPRIEIRTLHNGIRVAVLENHDFPVIDVSALVVAPAVLDPPGKEGVSALTAQMLAEGTISRSADGIAEAEADLGTGVGATGFFTIPQYFEPALALMADQLLHPAFPQAALDRIKANTVTRLQRLRDQPDYLAGRVLSAELYGRTHPYARTQTEASISAITRADLAAFHNDYYRPHNVSLIVAGDITPDRAIAALEHSFGELSAGGKDGWVAPPPPTPLEATRIYLYDRPTSPQSVIIVGQLGPPRDGKDYYVLELLNTVLGGAFNSRINLSLREVHGYTYGAESGFEYRRVPQPSTFVVETDVSTPTTDSSVADLVAEIRDIRSTRPVTDSELTFAKRTATLSLPLQFATVPEAADAAQTLLAYKLPLDYYEHLTQHFEDVSLAEVRSAAERYLHPGQMAIVVVGDRKVVEPGLSATHVAPIVDLESLPGSGRRAPESKQ